MKQKQTVFVVLCETLEQFVGKSCPVLNRDTTFATFDFDSLDFVELAIDLERRLETGIEIDTEEWTASMTLAEATDRIVWLTRENTKGGDMSEHERRVREMMTAFKQAVPGVPTMPDEKTRILRARLVLEEAMELIEAAGLKLVMAPYNDPAFPETRYPDGLHLSFCDFEVVPDPGFIPNLPDMIDAFADISVVNIGGFAACGVCAEPILAAVDANNLEKVAKGSIDEHGKFIKPPGHQPPDIAALLVEQGWAEV